MTLHKSTANASQDQYIDQVYRQSDMVATYAIPKLLPSEAVCFIRYGDDLLGRRVLDLGCGAGRLAVYLLPLVGNYTGFDISPYMLRHCRREFVAEFFEGDIRDLSLFEDHSFDVVLGVSNLFDAVSHEDRLHVLHEVHRILAEHGLLIFSAHNRSFVGIHDGPTLQWHRNPLTQLRRLFDYQEANRNRRRYKKAERFEPDYALINDSGNNFASLHYYIDRETQIRQLCEQGFNTLECIDSKGRMLRHGDDDSQSPSIHYVARRCGEKNGITTSSISE